MKIGWGTGIALFYIAFVASLLLQLKASFKYDHSLVVEDYYRHDLNYQEHYQKAANSLNLPNSLSVDLIPEQEALVIHYPPGMDNLTGSVSFFRPNNRRLDFELPVQAEGRNQQVISLAGRAPGLWRVKIDWQNDDSAFYDEKVVVF